ARSDVYSLGVMAYELLTCRHPFPHQAARPADRAAAPPLRRFNRAVTPAVDSIVRHCLEADPRRRYQGARELLEDIERHRDYLPLRHAPNPSALERVAKWRRRHPALTSATTVAVVAALAVAALLGAFVLRQQHL